MPGMHLQYEKKMKKFDPLVFLVLKFSFPPLPLAHPCFTKINHANQSAGRGGGTLLDLLRQSTEVGIKIYAHDMLRKGIT